MQELIEKDDSYKKLLSSFKNRQARHVSYFDKIDNLEEMLCELQRQGIF